MAKSVKVFIESQDDRKKKEESKAESKRMQALRENNMEAYTKLVKETKDVRLQYLLTQTDSYIVKISEMVQAQRVSGDSSINLSPEELARREMQTLTNLSSSSSSSSSSSLSAASSVETGTGSKLTSEDYYVSTHKKSETVQQPSMLKGGDLKEYQMAGNNPHTSSPQNFLFPINYAIMFP
jgi:hypothetical protein